MPEFDWKWPLAETIRTKSGWCPRVSYNLVQTEDALYQMRDLLTPNLQVVYDSETSGLNPRLGGQICGHCLAAVTGPNEISTYYIPVRHIGGYNETQVQLDPKLVADAVQVVLGGKGQVGFHNAKFDVGHLRNDGVQVRRKIEDSAIYAIINNENEHSFGLKRLADKYCIAGAASEEADLKTWMKKDAQAVSKMAGFTIPFSKRNRKKSPDSAGDVTYLEKFGYARTPIQMCGAYGCKDVFYTLYLWLVTFGHVPTMYPDVYAREHSVGMCLHEMEWNGLPVDTQLIRRVYDATGDEVAHWLQRCRELCGWDQFSGTDAEIGKVLYDPKFMDLKPLRLTKSERPSVDRNARKLLAAKHPECSDFVDATLKLARARKLHSTYSGNFLKFVNHDTGRIHASYNQLEQRDQGGVPVTGRLSSAEPNMQNIDSKPMHLVNCGCEQCVKEYGNKPGPPAIVNIHEYFLVPEGYIRFYIDFSQIELRVLTWFCQDPVLLRCYREDLDVHQIIADQLNISRKVAKQVNFGNSYGMTKKGLGSRLPGYFEDPEGTEAYAQEVLDKYFTKYANIMRFRRSFALQMRQNNRMFVNPFGRPRRIPTISAEAQWERDRAERMMMSSIISGTSADIMKESMLRCADITHREVHGGMLVQSIHDELVFDVPKEPGWANVLVKYVRAMQDWPQFSETHGSQQGVPIKVSAEITDTTWAAKREVEILDNGNLRWAA